MGYKVKSVPLNQEHLPEYVEDQLRQVSENLDLVDNLTLVELHVEPDKPRTGMVALADGTNWNPGSGAGFYGYRGGAWQFLG